MTTRMVIPWIAPISAQLRESRSEVVRVARQVPDELWGLPSALPGWSYKDLLAHLATGDWVFQTMLRDVTGIERGLPKEGTMAYVDDGNARRLLERKETSVADLIAEVEAEGEATRELLSKLTDAIDPATEVLRRSTGEPVTLEQWVTGFPAHDRTHLDQLRTVLDNVML